MRTLLVAAVLAAATTGCAGRMVAGGPSCACLDPTITNANRDLAPLAVNSVGVTLAALDMLLDLERYGAWLEGVRRSAERIPKPMRVTEHVSAEALDHLDGARM